MTKYNVLIIFLNPIFFCSGTGCAQTKTTAPFFPCFDCLLKPSIPSKAAEYVENRSWPIL